MASGDIAHEQHEAGARPAAGRWLRLILQDYMALLLCIAYAAVITPFVPELLSLGVLSNIVSDAMPLLIVAVGLTVVLIIGQIDLSVTAVISFASVVGASVMTLSGGYVTGVLGLPAGIAAMVAVGVLVGLINAGSVTLLNMPSFIVTLATTTFFSGTAIWYTTFHSDTSSIYDLPDSFTMIGDGDLMGVPVPVCIALFTVVVVHVILAHTVLGRWLYAVGKNPRAAVISGVPVRRAVALAFVIAGICAALSSVVYTARLQTGTPILGDRLLLDVVGAVVIGGTSLFGGKGKVLWTVWGVLFLVLIDTTLKLLGASLFAIYTIKGSVIVVAALLDRLRAGYLLGRRGG